jgi:hypothetical protein
MNDNNKVGVFVTAFITLIVGIVLLSSLADRIWLGTDATYTATDESQTLVNDIAISLDNNWVTSVTTILVTYDTAEANATLTEGDNYTVGNLNDDGVATVTLIDAAFDGNASYISYAYQDDDYIRDGSSRVFIKLITLFFAFAILATGLWAMYKMGIMDLIK